MGDRELYDVGVIMAGGSGERFWPLSRRERPKQLLRLTSSKESMLGDAVLRLEPLVPAERVYVITGRHLVEPIRSGRVGVPDENVLAEPFKRNTAGALCYAAAELMARYDDPAGERIVMAVVTADHTIGDAEAFRAMIRKALDAAAAEPVLVTIGIEPSRPETGYGYIQAEDPGGDVSPVAAFYEKPNAVQAEKFLERGGFLWNSGMFFWRIATFLAEFEAARPDFARATREMAAALANDDAERAALIFEELEDISIDYALMERARRAVVVRGRFPWDDVGAWTSLERLHPADEEGNVAIGDPVLEDCRGCVVYNAQGADRMAVGVIGMNDVIVVATEDGLLVMPKHRAQDVRKIVRTLREQGRKQT